MIERTVATANRNGKGVRCGGIHSEHLKLIETPELTLIGKAIRRFSTILMLEGDDAAMDFLLGCHVFTEEEKDAILAAI